MSPIVGIPACSRDMGETLQHATPSRCGEAVLDRLDALLLSGSPSNVDSVTLFAAFGAACRAYAMRSASSAQAA